AQTGSWQQVLQKYGTTANGNAPNVDALAQATDAGSSWLNAIPFIGSPLANLTTGSGQGGVFSELSTLLGIVTNVPRMVTIVAGLILLIAGLFLLGSRPAIQIVEKARGVGEALGAVAE
ncbi:MAG TPA: hypothetical protein VIY48_01845, partial [Candidatus Paceibacterota bacterium]